VTLSKKTTGFSYGKKNLDFHEKARLAGTIWNHGCIHIEYDKRSDICSPRIIISMKNHILHHYREDVGGIVRFGNNGYYELDIRRQALVKKRLEEVLPFIGGEEEEQIIIALKILSLKKERPIPHEAKKEMKKLYEEWLESRERLKKWITDFKDAQPVLSQVDLPTKIWNRTHLFEDP